MGMTRRAQKHPAEVLAAAMAQAGFPAGDGKNKAAQWLGQRGGKARAKALSPERRREIAKKAAKTRWGGA
jgi:hypothetical protein